MRKATKAVAICYGVVAGIAGLEHGYYEILQGSTRPASLAFPSMVRRVTPRSPGALASRHGSTAHSEDNPDGPPRFASSLWPWPLAILMICLLGMFPVGYFFNDFLKSIMGIVVLLILTMLPFSVYSAYAHDASAQWNQP